MNQFVEVPVKRGFEQIKDIYQIATREGAIIAGGWVRYMCSPKDNPVPAGDVDVFPQDAETVDRVRMAFSRELGYSTYRQSDVAYTMGGRKPNTPEVQIIKPIERGALKTFGTLQEIIDSFDFTVVRIGLLSESVALADECFTYDEFFKELNVRTINTPIAVVLRAQKYAEKGYTMSPTETLKLFKDWDARTPEFRQKLIDLLERENFTREQIREDEATLYWGDDD